MDDDSLYRCNLWPPTHYTATLISNQANLRGQIFLVGMRDPNFLIVHTIGLFVLRCVFSVGTIDSMICVLTSCVQV